MSSQNKHYDGNNVFNTQYAQLKDETNYSCDIGCLCKNSSQRTMYDQLQYNNVMMGLPIVSEFPSWRKNKTKNFGE